jgi:hypothetical protein
LVYGVKRRYEAQYAVAIDVMAIPSVGAGIYVVDIDAKA